jgi:hypothetical protein
MDGRNVNRLCAMTMFGIFLFPAASRAAGDSPFVGIGTHKIPLDTKIAPGSPILNEPKRVAMPDEEIEFHYKAFQLFYVPLWSYGGEFTTINGVPLGKSAAEVAERTGNPGKISKPFSYRVPISWIFLLVIGGLGGVFGYRYYQWKKEQQAIEEAEKAKKKRRWGR